MSNVSKGHYSQNSKRMPLLSHTCPYIWDQRCQQENDKFSLLHKSDALHMCTARQKRAAHAYSVLLRVRRRSLHAQGHIHQQPQHKEPPKEDHNLPGPGLRIFLQETMPLL